MKDEAQIRIDLAGPEPAYKQVAAQLRGLIVGGRLKTGDALPSVRRLAMDLGVHFNTVAEAYRQLADEGHIEVSHGKAARVVERMAPLATAETVEQYRRRLRNLLAEMRAAGVPAAEMSDEFRSLSEGDES